MESLVKPDFLDRMYSKGENGYSAYSIHEIEENDLKDAPTLNKVIVKLDRFIETNLSDVDPKDIVLFGTNVQFDNAFLHQAYDKVGKKWPFDYHILDLPSFYTSWYITQNKRLPESLRLKDMCIEVGISNDQPHSAIHDIATSVGILRHIVGEIDD